MNEIIQNLEADVTNGKENFCCISEKKLLAIKELSKRDYEEYKRTNKSNYILENLKIWLNEKLNLASQVCLENISQDTNEKVFFYNLALTTKIDLEHVLDKIKELESESRL